MSYTTTSGYLLLTDDANAGIATAGTPSPYAITMAIWIKPASATPAAQQFLMQFGESLDCYFPLTLTQTTAGKFRGNLGRTTLYESEPATASTTTDWWLLVAQYSPSANANEWGSLTAYLAKKGDTSFVAGSALTTPISNNGETLDCLYINRDEVYGTTYGANKYAEAAIWRTALTQSEREALLTARPNTVQASNLRGYWPLESNLNAGTGSSTTTALGSSGTVSADSGDHPYTSDVTVTPSAGTYRFVGQEPVALKEGEAKASPSVGTLRFVGGTPTLRLAIPEVTAPRITGNNTTSTSWAVGYPAHSTGDLVLIGLASDANVTHGTLPGGPNSETAVVLSQHEGDAGTATVRASLWYWIATDNEIAGTVTVTPSASEQWSASAVVIPAGTFDPANPMQDGGTGVGTTGANTLPPFTATLAGGRLGYFAACDADTITGTAAGWQLTANQDIGAVSSSFVLRDAATTASESVSGGAVTGVDDGRVSIGFVINPRARALPEPATFRFVGQEPTVTVQTAGGATVSPVVGTYQFVGQAPTVGFTHSVAPSVGTLVFAGQAPTISDQQYVSPSVGALRFDGLQPTVSYTTNAWASPTAGTYRFDGQQPSATVSEADTAQPLVGTLRFVGQTPSVTYTANVSVAPSVGTLRFVGQTPPLFDTSALIDFDTPAKNLLTGADQQKFRVLVRKNGTTAPTVDIDLYENGSWVADLVTGTSVTSDTGQIVSATWNAALLADISGAGVQAFIYGHSSADAQVEIGAVEWVAELEAVQTPTVGTLRFAGAAPSVAYTDHVTVAPSVGTYRVQGQQPSVTSSAAQTVAPSVGALLFVGQQPTATVSEPGLASPQVGTIRFVGQQPSVGYTHSADPIQAVLRLEGAYPSVTVTANQWASPSTGVVRTVGQTPTTAITANIWVAPVAGALRFDGQQPSLVEGGDKTAAPESGVLRFAGNAPVITLPTDRIGGDDLPPGWSKRRAKLKLNRELEYTEQIREIYRQLTGSPRAAEAEAIIAPIVPPVEAKGDRARSAAVAERAEALRVRADRLEPDAVQAEIALRLLYQQWRQQMEDDDVAAMEILLAHVL